MTTFADRYRIEELKLARKQLLAQDEEFAQFVFYHFGGYWQLYQNKRALRPNEEQTMRSLPKRISDRVTELAREFELKRGGP